MSKRANLIGRPFGKLVVEKYIGSDKNGQAKWLCRCSCGGSTITSTSHLNSGHTQSCGCSRLETSIKRLTIHGMDGSRFHTILSEISKLTGINYRTLYMRYRRTGDIGC